MDRLLLDGMGARGHPVAGEFSILNLLSTVGKITLLIDSRLHIFGERPRPAHTFIHHAV